jgi:hypothetical protein
MRPNPRFHQGEKLQLIRRFRVPALFCAFAVLVCELIARPYVNMGFTDDGPYILIAQTLATTGHLAYNGWEAAMIGWQLYLGAAFIKLFGFTLTTVRMSTLLVSMALAFVMQRILVRANITERNATIGTLAFVLSPLYLMLSVTFMTDIDGLFAVVLCLYGCLRALQASTSRAATGWICFAVATNAICGTSRQIEWLGLLVMVPSTLWLLRAQRRGLPEQRRVLAAGAVATLAGALFIFGCLHWYSLQPYTQPEHLLVNNFPLVQTLWRLIDSFLDIPFLLLPIAALFLLALRKSRPRYIAIVSALLLGYLFLAIYPSHLRGTFPLEPILGDWVNVHGVFPATFIQGTPPIFLDTGVRVLFTIASLGGLLSLIALLFRPHPIPLSTDSGTGVSWNQLMTLAAPFAVANIILLIPRAATFGLTERYVLGVLVVALPCLVRYYQDRVQPQLPFAGILLVAIMAIFGVTLTHNLFSFYRARVALAAELHAGGVPDTSVDNGWEYNTAVELQHSASINNSNMVLPPHAYVPVPPPPPGSCPMSAYFAFPHIHPLYGISFTPNACYGPAPFAPAHYSRWPYRTPGTLYVVNYLAPTKP